MAQRLLLDLFNDWVVGRLLHEFLLLHDKHQVVLHGCVDFLYLLLRDSLELIDQGLLGGQVHVNLIELLG